MAGDGVEGDPPFWLLAQWSFHADLKEGAFTMQVKCDHLGFGGARRHPKREVEEGSQEQEKPDLLLLCRFMLLLVNKGR